MWFSLVRLVALAALAVLVALALAGPSALLDVGPARGHAPADAPARVESTRTEPPSVRAVQVLEAWQDARARAWLAGDLTALGRLYVPGTEAARRDRAALRAYVARGLRVDLRTRTDALAVLAVGPRRVVVRQRAVVEAVALVHERRRVLPVARGWRRVELVRWSGAWRLRQATTGPWRIPREPP